MGADEAGAKRRRAAALREDGEPLALCDKGTSCLLSKEQWEKGEKSLGYTFESTFESVLLRACFFSGVSLVSKQVWSRHSRWQEGRYIFGRRL